jgi:glycosyltransferase involved in cell wall biosynthesis
MNVLMISLDSTLASPNTKVMGDTKVRHQVYATKVSNLFIVVKSPKGMKLLKSVKLAENLIVFPTSSFSRYSFVFDTFLISSNLCRAYPIDIITSQDSFITGFVGCLLKQRYGVPLNVQLHGDVIDNEYWINETRLENNLLNKLGKWVVKRADTIRVVSSDIKRHLMEIGIDEQRIYNIPTGGGIDVYKFASADGSVVRDKYLASDKKSLILFVGRLVKQKDLINYLQAVRLVVDKHPESLFLIVGAGSEEQELKQRTFELNLNNNMVFTGEIPYSEIPCYIAACDIFVLPSVYEGTARVLMEAAAAKKPIVSTEVSGARDIIADGKSGFVVPIRNPKELAAKIIYFLENPKFAIKMGQNVFQNILDNYDRQKNLNRLINMWQKTANCKRGV